LLEQADQDIVYEQDLLRDAGSVKPWLAYIEFKQQNGTLYEQAFVRRRSPRPPYDGLY
jgi:pre-mRNA-splicing factor SYF1